MRLYQVYYQYLESEQFYAGPYKFDAIVLPGCTHRTPDTVAVLLFGKLLLLQHGPVLPVTMNNAWPSPVVKDQARWDNIDLRTGWERLLTMQDDEFVLCTTGYARLSERTGYGYVQEHPPGQRRGHTTIRVSLTYFGLSDVVLVGPVGGDPVLWIELGRTENLYELLEDHEEIPWGI